MCEVLGESRKAVVCRELTKKNLKNLIVELCQNF